jgi:hypothetical protein
MKLLVIYGTVLAMVSMCNKENKNTRRFGQSYRVQNRIEIKKQPNGTRPQGANIYTMDKKCIYSRQIAAINSSPRRCKLQFTLCTIWGIAGKGDGKCPDFYDKAQFLRQVWKDNR